MVAHRGYEIFQTLCDYLESDVPSDTRKVTAISVGKMFHTLWVSGKVEQGTVNLTMKQYSAAFLKSLLIAKKYMVSESGVYAKHARVLDPNRRLNMPRVIGDYMATFGAVVKDPEMQEEWSAYWDLPSARAEKE